MQLEPAAPDYRAENDRLRACIAEMAARGAGCVVLVRFTAGEDAFDLELTAPTLPDETTLANAIGRAIGDVMRGEVEVGPARPLDNPPAPAEGRADPHTNGGG